MHRYLISTKWTWLLVRVWFTGKVRKFTSRLAPITKSWLFCSVLFDCVPISGPMIGTFADNTNAVQAVYNSNCSSQTVVCWLSHLCSSPADGTNESNRIKMCKQISTLFETMHNYREHLAAGLSWLSAAETALVVAVTSSCKHALASSALTPNLFLQTSFWRREAAAFPRCRSNDANRIH